MKAFAKLALAAGLFVAAFAGTMTVSDAALVDPRIGRCSVCTTGERCNGTESGADFCEFLNGHCVPHGTCAPST